MGEDLISATLVPSFDRFVATQTHRDVLVSVIFPRSRSRNFGLGLTIAETGLFFEKRTLDGNDWHFAAFDRSEAGIRKSLMAMDCLSGIKGVMPFINGRPVIWNYRLTDTLHCFLKGCAAPDPNDWCHLRKDDDQPPTPFLEIRIPGLPREIPVQPPLRRVKEWLVPCRKVGDMWRCARTEPAESFKASFVTEAARRECDWCPLFSADAIYIREIEV